MSNLRTGDRVILSKKGEEYGILRNRKVKTGTIMGHSRDITMVRVLLDGNKHPETFHVMYWDKIDEREDQTANREETVSNRQIDPAA